MATKELQELYAKSMALIKNDQETDPIIRLMNKRQIPEGARLRVFFDQYLKAQSDLARIQQLITDASGRLWALSAQMSEIRPAAIDLNTPIEEIETSDQWGRLHRNAERINELLGVWRSQEQSYQFKANDLGKVWDRAFEEWKSICWVETGQEEFRPAIVIADAAGVIWHAPEPFERDGIRATRARIEA